MYWIRIPAWRGTRLCTYRPTPFFAAMAILIITPRTDCGAAARVESPFTVREVEPLAMTGAARVGTNTVRIFTVYGLRAHPSGRSGAGSGHRPGGRRAGASRGCLHSGCRRSKGSVRCAASSLRGAHALPPRALRPDGGGQRRSRFELWPPEEVHHLQGAAFELTEQTAGVMVPSF